MFADLKELPPPPEPEVEPGEELFLDRLAPAVLERELEAARLMEPMAARGYRGLAIETSRQGREHRLSLRASRVKEPLLELRLSETTCVPERKEPREHGVEILYLLVVHWLVLQDPRAAFTASRPALPGQAHPGLGLGRRVLGKLMAWAYDWGKDALVKFPQSYHHAAFYTSIFQFLSPERQGRLEALRRDLAGLSVVEAAWAVEQGRVVEEPGGRVVRWKPAEMVAPLTRALKGYLKSDDYGQAVAATRDRLRFRVVPG